VTRAMLFAGTGVAWFAFWFATDPAHQTVASMQQWPNVLSFSAVLLLLAVALVTFGRSLGGRWVVRFTILAAAAAGAASIANIVEDGFRVEAAFFAFVLCLLVIDGALALLSVTILRSAAGRQRLLALVPAATLVAILLFPFVGGPVMLAAWLAASAAALAPGAVTTRPDEAYVS
jgi:hypothetical protein